MSEVGFYLVVVALLAAALGLIALGNRRAERRARRAAAARAARHAEIKARSKAWTGTDDTGLIPVIRLGERRHGPTKRS